MSLGARDQRFWVATMQERMVRERLENEKKKKKKRKLFKTTAVWFEYNFPLLPLPDILINFFNDFLSLSF